MAYQTFIDPNQMYNQGFYGYQYQFRPVMPSTTQVQPQPQPQPPMQPMQPSNPNVYDWVQGDNAAKAYPLGAGQSIILIDADNPFMFQKSTDITGKPQQLKYFSLNEISEEEYKAYFNGKTNPQEKVDLSAYVRKDEIEKIVSDATAKAIEKKMSEMSFRATTTPATAPVILA